MVRMSAEEEAENFLKSSVPCQTQAEGAHLADELCKDAGDAPHVYCRGIVRCTQQHLWRSVPERHNLQAQSAASATIRVELVNLQ